MVQSMQHNKLQLYNTLKIYLMLATHDHYDANTILNWFALYWQHTDPKNDALQKMQRYHLQQVLALSNTTWPQNKPLIAQAKSLLNALPPADIAFLELQGLYKNKQQSLATMLENHDDIDLSHAIIPSLFSSNNFKTVYNDQIPDLVKTLNQVNWVIGRATPKQPNPQHQAQLISSVRALYLTYFSKNWSAMVNHIDLKQPENFTDVQSLINEMTNPQSELMNLLSFISGNAALDKTAKPTANITLINQFLAKGDAYKQSKANMTHLSIYLKTIVASDNPNKASYNVVTSLLNNPQQSNPLHDLLSQPTKDASPILKWQLTIAKGSLHILLNHAKTYLNSVWDSTAFPDYNSNIENRYPVFSDSTEDTDVDTFSKFFAPNGTLDVFFNYYMKPFVNMNSNYWTWQTVYGVKLDMPQSTLDTFMRASLIQQMFFTDNHDSASFRFSLTPFAKSAAAQSVTLIIDGQTQHSSDHSHSSNILTWPGPKPGNAAITVQLQKGKPITQSFAGPWALFRLLAFAKITPTTNPQKYIVQFKLGEQTITYHMIMDNKVNPFLPGVLDRFRASANPF
ncbi:MAG: hypothetical protein COB66_00775 [Coxiella sp. (in: Bacteria)]|nr:MAG: hypothetical protein COB66_00775 [Coxiella sp. (in: g-proteobacteria)]